MSGPLTIVGLGPGRSELRTVAAQRAIEEASTIILRTRIHPGLDDLQGDARVTTCDDLYDGAESFDDIYGAIVDRVAAAVAAGPVVFAVPGHPLFGEATTLRLLAWATSLGVVTQVIDGVSAVDAVASALATDPLAEQLQMLDAAAIASLVMAEWTRSGDIGIDPRRPCLITQIYNRHIASLTKLLLGRFYPDDHPIAVVQGTGGGEAAVAHRSLYELDRIPVDHLSSVWVYAQEALSAARSLHTLQGIVNRLRSPEGCPWDRAQTHQTLRDAIIEEAYEVVDAIDERDPHHLAEELGDVVLQAVLHAQIADELGEFSLEDVWEQINVKLVRRHPHVFGDGKATNVAEVRSTWDDIKAREPGRAASDTTPLGELLRLPRSMPAMTRTLHLLGSPDDTPHRSPRDVNEQDIGDALLALLVKATHHGVDAESALSEALRRSCVAGTLGLDGEIDA